MNTKRLSLTSFLIFLTFSIGVVSIHSPLNVNAQNDALSQKGNGEAEQGTGQEQSSEQDDQVVSGDMSILSGNNLLCQNMDNTADSVLSGFCNNSQSNNPPPDGQLMSIVSIKVHRIGSVPDGSWGSVRIQDPASNIDITQQIQSQDREKTFYFNIPVSDRFSVTVSFPAPTPERPIVLSLISLDEESDCVFNSGLQCSGVKIPEQTHLQLNARSITMSEIS